MLGKPLPPGKQIGESWELYDFPPGVVDDIGRLGQRRNRQRPARRADAALSSSSEFGRELLGDVQPVGPHGQFPILIKFLDAREDLSVQVHPTQDYADAHPGAHLKTEAWYVVQNDPGARSSRACGPARRASTFEQAIEHGTVEQLISAIPVKPGHCHYLPSGTVHALGAGILVAEVQTPSDTTFRVFDFNRVDPTTGKPRKLHVEQALECIDFSRQARARAAAQPRRRVLHDRHAPRDLAVLQAREGPLHRRRRGAGAVRPAGRLDDAGRRRRRCASTASRSRPHFRRGETVLLPAEMKNPVIKTTEGLRLAGGDVSDQAGSLT